MLRNAIAFQDIAESQTNGICVFCFGHAIAQNFAGIQILKSHYYRAANLTIREPDKHIEFMTISVHGFEGMKNASVTLLSGIRPAESFYTFPGQDQNPPGDFSPKLAFERRK
ncbi:hypothetical protein DSCW_26170 [Desulfosarcina widdelii]|uniref:Uncharacterized protein n=1 Tax=Desulfosarcina widdelii TaxID=947919 RepID=A0A5K7Z3F8_9BACT|nr:hypothetical protein DSCW_26170 [Desulfosarcina widdelii]